ncbi:MAG: hypothetical protein ACI4Q4_02110 [Oscillospiraceae bacterium]
MLGVDFYRLFHTPMFYIFLAVAAVIPAMILGTSGADTTEGAALMYTSAWQIIAADTPIYAVSDMGEYANMNMVFIFGGIMVSIFIGHDYKSGYVKQLFTTHAKKAGLHDVQNPFLRVRYGLYVRHLYPRRRGCGNTHGNAV